MIIRVMKKHNTKQCTKNIIFQKITKASLQARPTMERKATATTVQSKGKRAEEQQEGKCPAQGKQPSSTTPTSST